MNLQPESTNILSIPLEEKLPELGEIPMSIIERDVEISGVATDENNYYTFTLTEEGWVDIILDNLKQNADSTLLNEQGEKIIDDSISEDNSLFSEENLDYYENQKARTNEEVNITSPTNSTSLEPGESYIFYIEKIDDSISNDNGLFSMENPYHPGASYIFRWTDNFCIEKIDDSISKDNGLFSEENLDYYENQKVWTPYYYENQKVWTVSDRLEMVARSFHEYQKQFLVNETVEFYQLTPKQKSLIQEYSRLANPSKLYKSNAERMREIIDIAKSDDLLSSLIKKIDSIHGDLGLFWRDKFDYYENLKAELKEFLSVNQTVESYQLTPKQKSLIQEYSKLANLSELSESNADRMGEILEMAESDDLLSSWIEKIDEEISEELGLFSDDNLDYYENQKAKIKEFIVC